MKKSFILNKKKNQQIDGYVLRDVLIVMALFFISSIPFLIKGKETTPKITSHQVQEDNVLLNTEEFYQELLKELEKRPDEVTMTYRGKNIKTGANVIEQIKIIQYSSNYYGNNLHQYTLDTEGPLERNDAGDYLIHLYGLKYRTTDRQEAYVEKEVKKIVKSYEVEGMNEYERVRLVYDYILDRKDYTLHTVNNGQSAYSFFKNGEGVCHAFALAAARLLDELGVENHFVFGDAGEEGQKIAHTWNKVKIQGEWYNIDTTWANPADGRDDYFLISDNTLAKTHTERTDKWMPEAKSTRFE